MSEYVLEISGKDYSRQIGIYQDFNEAKNEALEMKTEKDEYCVITEIIYDDNDGSEINRYVLYEIAGWL